MFMVPNRFSNRDRNLYSTLGDEMINRSYLKQKIVIISLIGLLLIVIGNFLPVIEIEQKTIDYNKSFAFFRYEGKYILLLVLFAFFLILFKEAKASILPIFCVSILIGYLIMNKGSIYTECSSYKEMFSWGYGFYILIIGNLLAYVAPIGTILKEHVSIKITRK